MRTLIIDRREWARGSVGGESALLNHIGSKCCLGFEALACGFTKEDIAHTGTPEDIGLFHDVETEYAIAKAPHLFVSSIDYLSDSPFVNRAVKINDNAKITEVTREKRLTALFEKEGIELEFIN